jgi:hypothetical protein
MDIIQRKPRIRVIIKRPDWKNAGSLVEYTIVTFETRECTDEEKSRAKDKWAAPQNYNAISDGLLSYSYNEIRQNIDSTFTLSITPEQDANGLTWIDKIASFDLVFIEEFGKIRYCGLVRGVRYASRMGPEGPERSITVEGSDLGEALKIFRLTLDIKLFINSPAEIKDLQEKSEFISKGDASLEGAINFYYNSFKKITMERGERRQSVLLPLIEKYISVEVDKNCKTPLPIVQSMYQMGVNTLYDILRKIIPEPMYELFGRWDAAKGKYVITARQCPFSAGDWKALPIYAIKPIILKEYTIGASDSDVYTVYYGVAPSFGYTNNLVMVVDNLHKNIVVDEELWKKYGYRPLSVELSFLKRSDIQPNDIESALTETANLLHEWHRHNERFLSGVISVISYEDDAMKYPSIGGRLAMLGGEFYIDQIQRRWTYGQSPTSEINVSRGGVYDNGAYSGSINGLGKRMKEFERQSGAGR